MGVLAGLVQLDNGSYATDGTNISSNPKGTSWADMTGYAEWLEYWGSGAHIASSGSSDFAVGVWTGSPAWTLNDDRISVIVNTFAGVPTYEHLLQLWLRLDDYSNYNPYAYVLVVLDTGAGHSFELYYTGGQVYTGYWSYIVGNTSTLVAGDRVSFSMDSSNYFMVHQNEDLILDGYDYSMSSAGYPAVGIQNIYTGVKSIYYGDHVNGPFGTQYPQAITATVTSTPSFRRQPRKIIAPTATASPSFVRRIGKPLTRPVTAAPTVNKRPTKTISAASTPVASVTKQPRKSITATVASAMSLASTKVFMKTITAFVTAVVGSGGGGVAFGANLGSAQKSGSGAPVDFCDLVTTTSVPAGGTVILNVTYYADDGTSVVTGVTDNGPGLTYTVDYDPFSGAKHVCIVRAHGALPSGTTIRVQFTSGADVWVALDAMYFTGMASSGPVAGGTANSTATTNGATPVSVGPVNTASGGVGITMLYTDFGGPANNTPADGSTEISEYLPPGFGWRVTTLMKATTGSPYTSSNTWDSVANALNSIVVAYPPALGGGIVKKVGLVHSISVSGTPSFTKRVSAARTFAVSAATTFAKRVGKSLPFASTVTASLAASRAYLRTLTFNVTGSPSFTKAVRVTKAFSAVGAASIATQKLTAVIQQAISVTVNSSVSMARRVAKPITVNVSGTPAFVRRIAKTWNLGLTTTADLIKQARKSISVTSTATASRTTQVSKAIEVPVTAETTFTKRVRRTISVTVGTLAQVFIRLSSGSAPKIRRLVTGKIGDGHRLMARRGGTKLTSGIRKRDARGR